MSKLAALALVLAVAGCALEDAPGKDLCVTEANCLSGHRCVEGHCVSGVAPDAGLDAPDQDAPVLLDGSPVPLDGPLSEPPPADLPPADAGPPDAPADGAPARCGNGVREGMEACDRGEAGDDFCDGQCRWKRPPQLSAARYNTCLRTGDDRIACWGDNSHGECSPHPLTGRRVAAGWGHTCALSADGSIECWGPTISHAKPPSGSFQDLAVTDSTACGVRTDGSLACWGSSFPGGAVPTGKFVAVALGPMHGCARAEDGTITCWGRNESGELDAPAEKFVAVSLKTGRSCGITVEHQLRCWGAIALEAKGSYAALTVGENQVCALTTAGAVTCWSFAGAELLAPTGVWTDVAAGAAHVCALRIDGGVVCWGNNDSWQVGPPRGPFLDVSVREQGGCAVTPAHDLACWGNLGFQMASGLMTAPPSGKFTHVSVGDTYACGVRQSDGGLGCWGAPPTNTVPSGAFESLAVPCAIRTDGTVACMGSGVRPPPDRFSQIAATSVAACGVRSDGKILCWTLASQAPLYIPPAGKFTAVALSAPLSYMTRLCGLRDDGMVACTDCRKDPTNQFWECGMAVPPEQLPSVPFQKIASPDGGPCTCGLGRDGRMYCWGAYDKASCERASNGREAVEFWSGCTVNAQGALLCDGHYASVDLDRPAD